VEPRSDERPDLAATVEPGVSEDGELGARIRNDGGPVGPFEVRFTVGKAPKTVRVDGLASQASTRDTVGGFEDAHGPLRVVVDPEDRVDEADEANNKAEAPRVVAPSSRAHATSTGPDPTPA
jgi:hypothetical protein